MCADNRVRHSAPSLVASWPPQKRPRQVIWRSMDAFATDKRTRGVNRGAVTPNLRLRHVVYYQFSECDCRAVCHLGKATQHPKIQPWVEHLRFFIFFWNFFGHPPGFLAITLDAFWPVWGHNFLDHFWTIFAPQKSLFLYVPFWVTKVPEQPSATDGCSARRPPPSRCPKNSKKI